MGKRCISLNGGEPTISHEIQGDTAKIKGKEIDDSAIGDDKILVYKSEGDQFVYEAKPSPVSGNGGGLVDKSETVTTDVNGQATVTFNTPYADTNYFILLSCQHPGDTVSAMFSDKTVKGFNVKTEDDRGADEPSVVVEWATGPYRNP